MPRETCFLTWWRRLSEELISAGHKAASLGEAKAQWDACDPGDPHYAAAWIIDNREATEL